MELTDDLRDACNIGCKVHAPARVPITLSYLGRLKGVMPLSAFPGFAGHRDHGFEA